MANYYASRGWVFISIYIELQKNWVGMNEEEVLSYYRGFSHRWNSLLNNAQTSGKTNSRYCYLYGY